MIDLLWSVLVGAVLVTAIGLVVTGAAGAAWYGWVLWVEWSGAVREAAALRSVLCAVDRMKAAALADVRRAGRMAVREMQRLVREGPTR